MIAVRSFIGHFARMNHPFQDDLGGGRHLQVVAAALHQLGAVTAQQSGEGVFGQAVGDRRHRTEDSRRVGAQGHGHGERLTRMLVAPLTVIQSAAAMAQPAHDDLVAADHLLTIDTQVLTLLVRPPGDRQAPGDQRRDVSGPAMLHGQHAKVDVVAFHNDLLAGRVLDHLGRHGDDLLEDRQLGPGIAQTLGRLGLLEERQQLADLAQLAHRFGAHAHGYPLGRAEQVAQHRDIEAGGLFEKQRRPFCAQGAVAHLGHFEHRRDGHLNAFQLSALLKLLHEIPKILEFHRPCQLENKRTSYLL